MDMDMGMEIQRKVCFSYAETRIRVCGGVIQFPSVNRTLESIPSTLSTALSVFTPKKTRTPREQWKETYGHVKIPPQWSRGSTLIL